MTHPEPGRHFQSMLAFYSAFAINQPRSTQTFGEALLLDNVRSFAAVFSPDPWLACDSKCISWTPRKLF
jgi:hypothetical protein